MTEKKPIYLVVTPFFPTPERWQGPFCYDFVRALIRTRKYDVRVFVSSGMSNGDYDYHGIKVRRFLRKMLPGGIVPFLFERGNRKRFLEAVKRAGIDWKDVAVFHAHDVSIVPYVRFVKRMFPAIKIVLHFHNMGHPFNLKCGRFGVLPIYSTLHYLWYRKWLELVDLPVFVSRRQQSMFGKWYPDGFLNPAVDIRQGVLGGKWLRAITLKPSYVFYNGIDYSVFNNEATESAHTVFTIGDVANVSESKDQLTLLRAAKRLKESGLEFKVRIVGSGDRLSACKDYVVANQLEGYVEFLTEVDHLKLPEVYRSFDLFVSPSWAEGFCCTFMEAHGCGVPIMGCTGVSVDEVFTQEDQKKWLFPPQDDARLADMIKLYYLNRPSQHFVQKFDIDDLVSAYIAKLESLIVG